MMKTEADVAGPPQEKKLSFEDEEFEYRLCFASHLAVILLFRKWTAGNSVGPPGGVLLQAGALQRGAGRHAGRGHHAPDTH